MGEIAKVTSINNNTITATLVRSSACGDCHACSVGMSGDGEEKNLEITAVNECDAKVGDNVNVELSNKAMLSATFIMYGIPLVAMIIGMLIGSRYSDVLAFVLGILFVAITFFGIKMYDKKVDKKSYMSVATKIVDPSFVPKTSCH